MYGLNILKYIFALIQSMSVALEDFNEEEIWIRKHVK